MAHTALKKITTEAKRIRSREGGSWKSAIKKAGAKYRAGKISGARVHHKKPAGKRRKSIVHKVKKLHAAEGRAIKSLGSVAFHVGHAKSQLQEQIGWAEAQKFAAHKKSTKRKIGKRIAHLKAQYRKLC